MKIEIRHPDSDYGARLDTEVMDVTIHEAFKGPEFTNPEGETLVVLHRDSGYELYYWAPGMSDPIMIEAKGALVTLDGQHTYDETGIGAVPESPPSRGSAGYGS